MTVIRLALALALVLGGTYWVIQAAAAGDGVQAAIGAAVTLCGAALAFGRIGE